MSESRLTTRQQLESIWKLGGLSKKELMSRVWQAAIDDDNLIGRAAELAFNFIFAVFPLMIFLLSVFGLFASRGTQLRSDLMFYLAKALPPSAFHVVSHTIAEISRNTGTGKLTFGIVLAVWFAAGGMTSMISALDGVYGVRDARPWWQVRAVAIILTIAISVLVTFALVVVLLGGLVANWIAAALNLGSWFIATWDIVQWPLAVVFVVVSFSLIYFYGPDLQEQHWYWITPGSLFGVLTWLAASFGFRVYLHFFNTYSRIYGSLGAVMILLFWFYVTGLAFLAGGEINAQIEHAAAEHGHPEAKAEGQKKAA